MGIGSQFLCRAVQWAAWWARVSGRLLGRCQSGVLGFGPSPSLRQVAVTSQPKANSQVRLCRGGAGEQGSTASGGQTVQIAGQGSWSSTFAAQVEVGVAVVVGSGWIGCPGGGDWRLETWMRRWARLDGS